MPTLDYSDIASPLERDLECPAATSVKEVKRSTTAPKLGTRNHLAETPEEKKITTWPQHQSLAEFIEMADGLE